MDILIAALIGGFLGVVFLKLVGFNPFGFGLGVAGLLMPLLTLLLHNDVATALVVLNQVVGVFPVLIMESLGATVALTVFRES
ncbi:MAG: hypothetical protein NTW48_04885 [Chloroflexi bacterium]|nr:hypothetical protein [Chloroflexota bacterium]